MSKASFRSLTEARSVRDRLLDLAMADGLSEAEAERWSQGGHEWKERIASFKHQCAECWDGYGIPQWGYLDELIPAIEYIKEQEALVMKGES